MAEGTRTDGLAPDLLPPAILRAVGDDVFLLTADGRIDRAWIGGTEADAATRLQLQDRAFADVCAGPDGRSIDVTTTCAADAGSFDAVLTLPGGAGGPRACRVVRAGEFLLVACRDTAERLRAEAAADDGVRRHHAMVEATAEIVWHLEVGKASRRRGFDEFTGAALSADDIHGWADFVHPDDRAATLALIADHVDRGLPYVVTYRLRHRDGTWRTMEDRAVPIRARTGEVVEWIGVTTDIHDSVLAETELQRGAQRLRVAIEATGLGIWDVDIATGQREWSDELKSMLGLPPDAEATEAALLARVHPEDRDAVARHNATTFLMTEGTNEAVFRILRADDGDVRWIRSRGRVLRDADGRPARRIGVFQDVTAQRVTNQALAFALRRYEALIAATSEIVWHANATQEEGDGKGWTEFTGQAPDKANGDGWLFAVHPEDRKRAKETCKAAMAAGTPYSNEYRLWNQRTGEFRWVSDRVVPLHDDSGQLVEWVGIIADIHGRKSSEERIWKAAHTDHLTGLANRAMFQMCLDEALALGAEHTAPVSLVLVDLDRFKETNDSLGHDAGDFTLRAVADTLRAEIPDSAIVARLGGDEFGIILPGSDETEASAVAARLVRAIDRSLDYGGVKIDCSATAGFAVWPDHDADAGTLLKNADIALYAAKSSGRGRAVAFHEALRNELARKVTVLRAVRDALARGAVMPFYQPKVSLGDGRVVGFEALMRWSDGARLRTPGDILGAFDDHDLAPRIGARMLTAVIDDMLRWRGAGIDPGPIAINVSAPEFGREGFADTVLSRMAEAGLPASRLELEITESVLVGTEADETRELLRSFRAAGVAVALDDFGTGYASLTHLKKFPVSWLKIDRSFVMNLETDRDSRAIVHAVLGMARNIGIRVVAEGVETEWQRRFLADNGCDVAQGYLFAKPMAGSRLPRFLQTFAERSELAPPFRRRAG